MKHYEFWTYLVWCIIVVLLISAFAWGIYHTFSAESLNKKVRFSEQDEIYEIPSREESFIHYL